MGLRSTLDFIKKSADEADLSGFIHRSPINWDEGGPKGTRTPDLSHAMGTRYQLRYGPKRKYSTRYSIKFFSIF